MEDRKYHSNYIHNSKARLLSSLFAEEKKVPSIHKDILERTGIKFFHPKINGKFSMKRHFGEV